MEYITRFRIYWRYQTTLTQTMLSTHWEVNIDLLITSLMLGTEKECHKLNTAHYEFSWEVKWWLDRCQQLRQLLRIPMGKNISNITTTYYYSPLTMLLARATSARLYTDIMVACLEHKGCGLWVQRRSGERNSNAAMWIIWVWATTTLIVGAIRFIFI